ncbi:hypothetical protein RclHR1_39980002 [Rhizophagus clarus]|uniref:Uncharacterized protein n=1 Tax=Rhizophagus clarus TaxID=94130 RepID=A0A2Z6RE25_9GLOM|nr:hypothetical protein RclHR1_39980002 [Rhizophagus clarus]
MQPNYNNKKYIQNLQEYYDNYLEKGMEFDGFKIKSTIFLTKNIDDDHNSRINFLDKVDDGNMSLLIEDMLTILDEIKSEDETSKLSRRRNKYKGIQKQQQEEKEVTDNNGSNSSNNSGNEGQGSGNEGQESGNEGQESGKERGSKERRSGRGTGREREKERERERGRRRESERRNKAGNSKGKEKAV